MYHGERFNAGTHLFGVGIAVACAATMLARMARHAEAATLLGPSLFSVAAIALYVSSTAFHSTRGRARQMWQRLDHAAIFLLIAGTYTPFALAAPQYPGNLALLGVSWVAALSSVVRHLRVAGPPDLRLCVALGWVAVAAALPVTLRSNSPALACLLVGAASYSLGTIFYLNRAGWRHAHGVWHLFVIGGTTSHYAAVTYLFGPATIAA